MNNLIFSFRRFLRIPSTYIHLHNTKYFFHYTADLSGGVASWIRMFCQTFSDTEHLIACARGIKTPAAQILTAEPNTHMIAHLSHREAMIWVRALPAPLAILNHVFWDLQPITKQDVGKPEVPVIAFMRGSNSRLDCDVQDIDKLIVFSNHYQETYNYSWSSSLTPIILPHGVNTERFAQTGPSRTNQFVIGNITNGGPWKHSADFVPLCLEIKNRIPVVTFDFLGAIDLNEKVRNIAGFTIRPPYSIEVPSYLNKISLLTHKTSDNIAEGWSNAIGEAITAGIPVVAEAKGGIRDQIVHGVTGFLCESNADYIEYVELLYRDIELYWKISTQAREYAAKHFSLISYRRRVLELLELSITDDTP